MIWFGLMFLGFAYGEYIATIDYGSYAILTATVINPKIVISTARELTDKDPRYLLVRAGSSEINKGGQCVAVEAVIIHPLFDQHKERYDGDTKYDLAMIQLVSELKVQPGLIDIAELPQLPKLYNNEKAVIQHWGKSENGNYNTTTIDIRDKEQCQKNHNINCTIAFWAVTPNCNIKWGAPVLQGSTLIGIVNDHRFCKSNGDIFINNMSYFRKWVEKIIKESLVSN